MSDLLNIQNLRVHFDTLDGPVEALHSVSLSVKEGEIMGVVGESGCGKSVTSLVTIGLASCEVDEGSITFEDKELIHEVPEVTAKTLTVLEIISSISGLFLIIAMLWLFINPSVGSLVCVGNLLFLAVIMSSIFVINTPSRRHEQFLRSIRGNKISMIFQEPMTALNPLYTVEKQVSEVLRQHGKLDAPESSLGLRIGQALVHPATLLTNFVRNDKKTGLQLLGAFFFIFIVHQSGNSDTILDLLIYPIALLADVIVWLLNILDFIPDKLGLGDNISAAVSLGEFILVVILGSAFYDVRWTPEILRNEISRTPQIIVSYVVLFILLWVPFGVLMTIVGSVAILAIPPIQISGFLRLDPAHSRQVVNILREVKIPNPKAVIKMYPHELSGGMRQRVMIAMMMACEPKLLIADEPTTALDVTIQAQILKLMKDLREREKTSIMLITHDLGVIAEMCDTVSVMYAGRVVERAPVVELFSDPKHAYTRGLIQCTPSLSSIPKSTLATIPGQVANPSEFVPGCRFCQRMGRTGDTLLQIPDYTEISPGHWVEMCEICIDPEQDKWE